tara:strand:- start:869 stop:1132 length:264 start_codon:yes stop_codon:yes gene_type:complete
MSLFEDLSRGARLTFKRGDTDEFNFEGEFEGGVLVQLIGGRPTGITYVCSFDARDSTKIYIQFINNRNTENYYPKAEGNGGIYSVIL